METGVAPAGGGGGGSGLPSSPSSSASGLAPSLAAASAAAAAGPGKAGRSKASNDAGSYSFQAGDGNYLCGYLRGDGSADLSTRDAVQIPSQSPTQFPGGVDSGGAAFTSPSNSGESGDGERRRGKRKWHDARNTASPPSGYPAPTTTQQPLQYAAVQDVPNRVPLSPKKSRHNNARPSSPNGMSKPRAPRVRRSIRDRSRAGAASRSVDGQPNPPSTIGRGTAVNAASAAGTDVASMEEGRDDGGLGGEPDDGAPLPRNAVVDEDEDDELEDQCNVETIEFLLAAYAQEAAAELLTSPPGKSEERGDEAPFVTECLDDLFIRNQCQREAVNRLVDVAATSQEDDVAEYLGQKLTSYLQLYQKVKANPGGYDPAILSDAFNRDRVETGERIERAERKGQSEHLSSQINQGNPTSPSTLVLGVLHFGPTGSKSNGRYDCNAHDQCCIKALRQSLNRCTFHACFGERTEETFEEEMPTVDLLPINADKGSQDELDAQVEACASRLGLASKYEVYAINLLNYIGHAIVHLAQHQSALTVVVASSVTSERWFSEVGRGKYLLGILKSPGANVVFTIHPQAWLMGVNQSLRLYPEDIRGRINSTMKFVLGKLIRQELLGPQEKETFDNYVCDVMSYFGRKGKWVESNIERGMLSYLAKVAANHSLLSMSGEDLASALTSGRLNQDLGEDTVALFLAQIDLHGPPTFMGLLRKFRAGHELNGMAKRLNADLSVPDELKPDIKRAMTVLKKDEAYIMDRLRNLRGVQELNGMAKRLNADLPVPDELKPDIKRAMTVLKKDEAYIMDRIRNLRRSQAYADSLATLASQMFNGELQSTQLVDAVASIARMGGKPPCVVMQKVANITFGWLKQWKSSFDQDGQDAIDRLISNPSISMNELLPLIDDRLERHAREAAEKEAKKEERQRQRLERAEERAREAAEKEAKKEGRQRQRLERAEERAREAEERAREAAATRGRDLSLSVKEKNMASKTVAEIVKDPGILEGSSTLVSARLAKIMKKHGCPSNRLYDEYLQHVIRERVATTRRTSGGAANAEARRASGGAASDAPQAATGGAANAEARRESGGAASDAPATAAPAASKRSPTTTVSSGGSLPLALRIPPGSLGIRISAQANGARLECVVSFRFNESSLLHVGDVIVSVNGRELVSAVKTFLEEGGIEGCWNPHFLASAATERTVVVRRSPETQKRLIRELRSW